MCSHVNEDHGRLCFDVRFQIMMQVQLLIKGSQLEQSPGSIALPWIANHTEAGSLACAAIACRAYSRQCTFRDSKML